LSQQNDDLEQQFDIFEEIYQTVQPLILAVCHQDVMGKC